MITNPINLVERLNAFQKDIKSDDFLKGKGTAGEVNFHIFDYNPADELTVRSTVKNIVDIFNKDVSLPNIIEFDLYDMTMNYLKSEDLFDATFELEADEGWKTACETVSGTLGMTEEIENNVIVKMILEQVKPNTIVFITGVGKVYPILRSHTVLNNLWQKIVNNPVVMFYPGEYSGTELHLFNTLKDDNYYRAAKKW